MMGVLKEINIKLTSFGLNFYQHFKPSVDVLHKIVSSRINTRYSNSDFRPKASVGSSLESMNQKRVVVIGAGAAGIAAATRLYEKGIEDVLVLEAENRIGGRIHTVDLPNGDGFIELGAQWVHGEGKNVVFELMSGRDLLHSEGLPFTDFEFVRSSSELVDRKMGDQLYDIFRDVQKCVEGFDLKKFKHSGDFFMFRFKEVFQEFESDAVSSEIKDEFIHWCHQYLNSYDGTDSWFDSSALTLSEFYPCDGYLNVSWKKQGYRTLFSILMEKAEEMSDGKFLKSHVLTNKEVRKIRVNENDVTVECQDGSSFSADHVILTVSLGVLKEQYKHLFENIHLPARKVKAIEKLGIGCVSKLFFKFPYQWIPQDRNGLCVLWKNEDVKEYSNQGLKWVTDIFAFCRVDNAPNMICGWVTGSSAREIELLEESEVMTQTTRLLRKLVGHQYKIPDPEYFIGGKWSSNPHFRGSYRFLTTETDGIPDVVDSLMAPLENKRNIPVILFAGEATHKHYYSTVHGAVETGWREADRILTLASCWK